MMEDSRLSVRMAGLARDLEAMQSPEATLQGVVDAAVELIGPCQTAGISLASRQGAIETSASTAQAHTRADELQQETGEGPCMDAVWEQPLVRVADLALEEERWPRWAPRAAHELGLRSMVSVRLFTHADRVGALNMFSLVPDAFTDDDVVECLAIAAHAAVALAVAGQIGNLQVALHSRTVTSQAVGILMTRHDLTADHAFTMLRRLSGTRHRKLHDVAAEIVEEQDRKGR